MKRKVYLEGDIAQKFGKEFTANVTSVRDVFRLMEANHPTLKKYLVDCHEKGIGFSIQVADKSIEKEEDLLTTLNEGDITIFAVPAGSKSGGAKILAAIAIVAIMFMFPGTFFELGKWGVVEGLTWQGMAAATLAINLSLTGLQQLMAPDPSVDSDGPEAYLFNGSEQNIIEGDPVPILYGELRVPGRPIAFSSISSSRIFGSWQSYNTAQDPDKDGGVTTTTKES